MVNPFHVIDRGIAYFGALPAPEPPRTRATTTVSIPAGLAGGRLSTDNPNDQIAQPHLILPPNDPESGWRLGQLDDQTLGRMSPIRLMEVLADLSPELSRGLWDFLRLCNPGWEATALRPGTEEQDPRAQAVLDGFIAQLAVLYGDFNILPNRLFMNVFLRGALFAELILDDAGRMPVDVAVPDAASARFRRQNDPVRGLIWQLGQWQVGQFVPLDRPTIQYLPIDPFPGSPYGRPLASAALFATLFLLAMLHDLRRVVQQQGYPRIDLEIDLAALAATTPPDILNEPDAYRDWVNGIVAEVKQVYSGLQPDDAYVHANVIKVNRPVGTVDASSLGAVSGLIDTLEHMVMRAVKSMPILMGFQDRTTGDAATREWEIHAAGIKSIQHLTEVLLERLLGIALQVQGIGAEVRFRFAELRTAELLRDAQVVQIGLTNARMAYDNGLISQDEQAQMALNKPKADAPEPRAAAGAPKLVVGGVPDPASTKAAPVPLARDVELGPERRNGHVEIETL